MSRQQATQGQSGSNRNLPYRPDTRGKPPSHKFPSGGGDGGGGNRGPICHLCREPGHIANHCPHGGHGGPSTQRAPPKLSLTEISVSLAKESATEDIIVQNLKTVSRTAEKKPCRPSYGIKGNSVEFRTNYFPVKLPSSLVLYRYRITIDPRIENGKQLPEPKNKQLKRIVKLMLDKLQLTVPKSAIATDFKSTLICNARIPQDLWVQRIQYFHEDDVAPNSDSRTYTLRIEETLPSLMISVLQEFLASTSTTAPFSQKEPVLQALNIVLGHHAKSSQEIDMIGGNRAYANAKNGSADRLDLKAGLEAIRGYFLSVRLASFRTIMNVNVSHGAFYEAIWLPTLIDKWTAIAENRDSRNVAKWNELETFLRGVKVKTQYLKDKNRNQVTQVRSIKNFAWPQDGVGTNHPPYVEYYAAPAVSVWFFLDDGRDFRKQKFKCEDSRGRVKDKYISVDEFFKSNYSILSDQQGRYPVVNFGSRKDHVYVPAEACTVESGQLAKLNSDQNDTMITFAARNPSANEASIKSSGLSILGLSPRQASLAGFNVEIDDNMLAVHGRMLAKPIVLYKNNSPAKEVAGGWNLTGNKFQTAVSRLKKWACLRLLGNKSTTDLFDAAIAKFREILEAHDIKSDRPSNHICVFDNKKVDFFTKENRLCLDDLIRRLHQDQGIAILLVLLPKKDTALYNRIKKLCDQREGIHTVCVVEKMFCKKIGTYLANLTLKFNLKLGGTNHKLNDVDLGIISKGTTMVVGIDVVHPSPGSGKANIASMVASVNKDLAQWPVDLQVQVREGQEMLDKIDIMLESRLALWKEYNDNKYPENIIVYRDGVSEGQYQQAIDEELAPMRETCRILYKKVNKPLPMFTLVIVGKRHHTRFFPPKNHVACDQNGNPDRGLVVDRGITEARNWDFFLQSHNAVKGTARPAHYYVLWDEIFTNTALQSVHDEIEPGIPAADRLERLSHSLCYMFSRAAKAVSIPAPVYYADIACTRASRYLAEAPTGSQSATSDTSTLTPAQRAKLCADLQAKITVHKDLKDKMFYV